MDNKQNNQIRQIALFVASACVLQVLESLIPHPIPGVRFGLANMITLVVLITIGFKAALEVAVLRTVVSSFILGSFLSPSFILSFSGSLGSALIMGAVYAVSRNKRVLLFSIIGISIVGSITHNSIQILLVYVFFIKHKGIFMLVPYIGISSVIMGWISGMIAVRVCKKLETVSTGEPDADYRVHMSSQKIKSQYIDLHSPIHRITPAIKIISVIVMGCTLIIVRNITIYNLLFIFLLSILFISRVSIRTIFSRLKKLSLLIVISFWMPLLFSKSGKIVMQWGFLTVTDKGIQDGTVFAFRILLLIISSLLLTATTSPEELTAGIRKILRPFRVFGISEERISSIIITAWMYMPALGNKIRAGIKKNKFKKKKLKEVIPSVADLVADMYKQDESKEKPD